MRRKISRDTRNTIASYILFFTGCIIMPLFLISFESAAYGVNLIAVMFLVVVAALATSALFYNLKTQMHFAPRFAIYFLLLCAINIFIWMVICDGTFRFRE